ncbi:MAG: N-acetyltransferase [Pacificimonas sp.]
MPNAPIIRPERSEDSQAIHALTKAAFAPMLFAGGNEPDIVDALRDAGALTLSLVAEQGGEIVGHVAFSPMTSDDGAEGWCALGPVSAAPDRQKQGIGRALIEAGLDELRAKGAAGCALTGNPLYYRRFGFEVTPDICPPGEPAEYFMTLPLAAPPPSATLHFHPIFHA